MSQGYCNNGEAMRNDDGVFPLEYHGVDDDARPDADDTADDPAATTAGDRFVAFGEQGPGRDGNADAAEPGVLQRQRLHRSRRAHHESGHGGHETGSSET